MSTMPSKSPEAHRAAVKKHYDNHKDYYAEKNQRAKARKAAYIRSLRCEPCADCGQTKPWYVMQFDHLHDKKWPISSMSSQSWKRIEAELAKCELVCADCHATRTHFRRIASGTSPMVEASGLEPEG